MKIIIAEDQGLLRGALSTLLALEDDIEVVGLAENGQQALELIRDKQPDICVMDIEMPEMSGLEVAEAIQREGLPIRVVIVTTFARSGYFQRAMKAGVQGYLLKDAPVDDLADALRKIQAGGKAVAPELAMSMWVDENPLTEREQAVLRLTASGMTAQEVAAKLFLSHGTIRNYMSEILHKLNAKNRIDAIAIAEEKGWLK